MFKECSGCKEKWGEFYSFLKDRKIEFVGYQPNFDQPEKGFFLFNHLRGNCLSTIGIQFDKFPKEFFGDLNFKAFEPNSQNCPGFCSDITNLNLCDNKSCNGRVVRLIIQEIKKVIKELRLT